VTRWEKRWAVITLALAAVIPLYVMLQN